MEASRFGFDFPPAYKFDPTDADLVAHYLLPLAAGVPIPYAHAIIDDDPCSCPPWELLRRHGLAGSDQAFFFGPPSDASVNGGRACRVVRPSPGGAAGGLWRGQKSVEADLVVVPRSRGAELRLRYKRYNLTYYGDGDPNTSGWVMHEYHILQPKMRHRAVLSRIRITGRAKKGGKQQQQSDVVHQGDDGNGGGGVLGENAGGYYTNFLNAGEEDEDDGYYADDSNNYFSFNPDQPGPSSYTPPEMPPR